jgi:hypothetical protein
MELKISNLSLKIFQYVTLLCMRWTNTSPKAPVGRTLWSLTLINSYLWEQLKNDIYRGAQELVDVANKVCHTPNMTKDQRCSFLHHDHAKCSCIANGKMHAYNTTNLYHNLNGHKLEIYNCEILASYIYLKRIYFHTIHNGKNMLYGEV